MANLLGRRTAASRARVGMTLAAVAKRAGLSTAYLSQIEAGSANPTLRTLVLLADALECDVAHLLGADTGSAGATFGAHVATMPLAAGQHVGSGIWDLTGAGSDRLAARLVQGEPVGHTAPTMHPGEEFVLVLHGSCSLHIGSAVHRLNSGDTCHFAATEPHCYLPTSADLTLCVVLGND